MVRRSRTAWEHIHASSFDRRAFGTGATMSKTTTQTSQVRDLNDGFRHAGPTGGSGQWFLTAGVHALGVSGSAEAMRKVRDFDQFTEDNDPYGTHDFGAFELMGERLFWKIDCYGLDMQSGSPDEADPTVTRRVLTIMLASEY